MTDEAEEPFYTRSNGVRAPLKTMATPHLKSALAKLARELPDHPEIPAMDAEAKRRDAEFAAQQEQAEL